MIAGVELRKERRLSEILTDSFNIFFAHWRKLAVIAVPLVVLAIAVDLLGVALTPEWLGSDEFLDGTREITTDDLADFIPLGAMLLLSLPVSLAVQQLVSAATIVFLDEVDRGNEVQPADALDRAQGNLGALLGAALRSLLIGFLFFITIIGIPFAINRTVRWFFIAQTVMLDGKRGEAVLEASSELVKGRWWNTLGRIIVVSLVIGIPIGFLAQALGAAIPGVLGSIVSSLTVFISASYGIIALSLMYFDLKARKSANDNFSPDREPLTEPDAQGQGPGYV